jgi:hypothetical protein
MIPGIGLDIAHSVYRGLDDQFTNTRRQRNLRDNPSGIAAPATPADWSTVSAAERKKISDIPGNWVKPPLTPEQRNSRAKHAPGNPAHSTAYRGPAELPPEVKLHAASTPENEELTSLKKELADLYKSQITSKEDMRSMALLQAGLGIAAGESPYFATNVGRGAQAGIESWNAAQKGNQEATSNYAQLLQRQAEVSAAGRRADRGLDIQQQQANTSSDRALAYTQNMAMKGTGQNKVVAQALLAHHNLIDKMLVEEVDGQGMPLTPERKQQLQTDLYNTKAKMRDFQSSSSGTTGGFDFDSSDSANGGIG